jgi:type II secretory pathway pseudopilin PulG
MRILSTRRDSAHRSFCGAGFPACRFTGLSSPVFGDGHTALESAVDRQAGKPALQENPRELRSGRNDSAFTMVEIALCLAIVGFALVAIIGVLPTGMNVQRDNRQQTIVNQDAAVWLDAIRSGARGFDDLTNYVMSITNLWADYDPVSGALVGGPGTNWYTVFDSNVTSGPAVPNTYGVDNGYRIIGLLSTPRYVLLPNGNVQSNYIIANVRSFSGAVVEKNPQRNPDVLEGAFAYRMIVENTPYLPVFPDTNAPAARLRAVLRENSRDLRLTFRWPLVRNTIGNGRQTYRQVVSGAMRHEFDFFEPSQPLHFFESSTFAQLPQLP